MKSQGGHESLPLEGVVHWLQEV